MFEKLQDLTDGQLQELYTLKTAEEVLTYAKSNGIDLTTEEATQLLSAMPDDLLENIAGGMGTFTVCYNCGRVGPMYLYCECGAKFGVR